MHTRKKHVILIICRGLNSLETLSDIEVESHSKYVLASDDPRVHALTHNYPWIKKTCWIEKMESFFKVADDVMSITESVNEWLRELSSDKHGFQKELLFFDKHVEGGMTTQRIQDALLLIRSYVYLLESYDVKKVLTISAFDSMWHDDVLVETCRSRNVEVEIVSKHSIDKVVHKLKHDLTLYSRALYYVVNVLRIKLISQMRFTKLQVSDTDVVFQLHSSSNKHVGNFIPLMKAVKNKGYNPVALCWHSHEKFKKEPGVCLIRKEGLYAEELERSCSFKDILKSVTSCYWTWSLAKKRKKEFISKWSRSYKDVQLSLLLWPSVKYFIIVEIPQIFRVNQALKRYFASHDPLAIRLWGETALKEGYLAWQICSSKKNKPVAFIHFIGTDMNWPYKVIDPPEDLFFVAGKYHEKYMVNFRNISKERVKVTGQSRFENIYDFRRKYTKDMSLNCLNIPSEYTVKIFFDPNVLLMGVNSSQELSLTLDSLLSLAKKHQNVALIIKPHPGHKEGLLECIISSYALNNVFQINKKMNPSHCLNASDVLITKASTLGVEAMLFDCPVICCLLDKEENFIIYENGADYIYTIKDLINELERIIVDDDYRSAWHKKHMGMQKKFMKDFSYECETLPSVLQAELLDDCITSRVITSNSN